MRKAWLDTVLVQTIKAGIVEVRKIERFSHAGARQMSA